MKALLTELTSLFLQAIHARFPENPIPAHLIEVVPSSNEKFGPYQCNSAMKLAGPLKAKPRDIAQQILNHLPANPIIAHCDIAGPGFINIQLSTDYLNSRVNHLLTDSHLGISPIQPSSTLLIDFSSPNAAKEMHVGHLRSTIIGDCLSRLFEFLGYNVLRISHLGDWGTAFGMLIAHMQEVAPEILQGQQSTALAQLMQWYKESKKRFDEDEDFKKRAKLAVVALQAGDPASLKAWQIICEISRQSYQEIYDLLDVQVKEQGESFYNPMLADTILDLENKNLVTLSEGAKCIFLEGFNIPILIQKSDGGYNYSTTDLAALRYRVNELEAKRIIYVTDSGQALHFKMIFNAAEKAGYVDFNKVQIDHVGFGLVLGPDGKKFKTRSGETERLLDLLTAAIAKAKTILIEKEVQLPEPELSHTATILGINAIKYADLANNRINDYVFSYDRMLKFEGNTAAFLMYSYVRINGIKRKVGKSIADLQATITLSHPAEIALSVQLCQFHETLETVAKDLLPHRLTEYLFNLAERFNIFFRDCRVEGDAAESSRLLLCEATARVLRQGLGILGLRVVDKM